MYKTLLASPWRRLPIALLPLFMLTCEGIDNIDITTRGNTVIPQGSVLDELLGSLAFTGFDGFDIAESQEFRNQGYTKEQIDSVRLTSMTLTIDSPADGNFDFLQSVSFYAEADGLDRIQIARIDPVPRGVRTLELEVDDMVELEPYVVSETVTITTEATGLRPPQETTVSAAAVFNVDVSVTGACQ